MTAAGKLAAAIQRLAARPDLRVRAKHVPGPASAAALSAARGKLPAQLLAFYAEHDGIELAWEFANQDLHGGGICIPPLRDHLAPDSDHAPAFGPGRLSVFLDQNSSECCSYIVASADDIESYVVMTAPAGEERMIVARSLDEYIERAIARSFVSWWMYDSIDVRASVEALASKPKKLPKLVVDARAETGNDGVPERGTVREIQTVQIPEHDSWREDLGPTYVLLELDAGHTMWTPAVYVRLLAARSDVYERAIATPREFWRGLGELPMIERIAEIARALGPVGDQGRRAAGMLSPLPFDDAARTLAATFETATKEIRDLGAPVELGAGKGVVDAVEWRRYDGKFTPREVLERLLEGLAYRIADVSAREQRPPRDVLGAAAANALRWVPGRTSVLNLLKTRGPAPPHPRPSASDAHRDKLGLDPRYPLRW